VSENVSNYTEAARENISDGIRNLFEKDPGVSIVLARKAFEDKGYDWRLFKDAFNDLVQSEQIDLNDDQRNQLNYLDSPPLSSLEKILHGLNLVGR
jgi:hypothetical protein